MRKEYLLIARISRNGRDGVSIETWTLPIRVDSVALPLPRTLD